MIETPAAIENAGWPTRGTPGKERLVPTSGRPKSKEPMGAPVSAPEMVSHRRCAKLLVPATQHRRSRRLVKESGAAVAVVRGMVCMSFGRVVECGHAKCA